MRCWTAVSLAVLRWWRSALLAYAQGGGASSTGTIQGRISDQQGALLPNVIVTATSPSALGVQTRLLRKPELPVPRNSAGHLRSDVCAHGLQDAEAHGHHQHPWLHHHSERRARAHRGGRNRDRERQLADHRHVGDERRAILQARSAPVDPGARHVGAARRHAWCGDGAHRRGRQSRGTSDPVHGLWVQRPGARPPRRDQRDRGHRRRQVSTSTTPLWKRCSSGCRASRPKCRIPAFRANSWRSPAAIVSAASITATSTTTPCRLQIFPTL